MHIILLVYLFLKLQALHQPILIAGVSESLLVITCDIPYSGEVWRMDYFQVFGEKSLLN